MSKFIRNAFDYAYGINGAVSAGRVRQANTVTGSATSIIVDGYLVAADGESFLPYATNAAFTIGVGTNAETVTPTAVAVNSDGTVTLSGTFANVHGIGDILVSSTSGGQEAINASVMSGLNPNIDGTVLSATVIIPNASVLTLFSVGTIIIPAPGAGKMIDVDWLVLENVFKTGAYAGGGAIQASYGTGVTNPATATIAATFLTSPVANQVIKVAGALASTLSSAILNTAVYLNAATANFTTGAGSLIVKVQYRVLSGL